MRVKVTDEGVLIPRALLEGVEEVEIREENNLIVVEPVPVADPIFEFGTDPVAIGVSDAAEHHDRYLYGR